MTLSIEIIVFVLGIVVALIGLIYNNLDRKISSLATENRDLRNGYTDKNTCMLRIQLSEERFLNMHKRIEEVREQNKEYHEILAKSLTELHETVDSIRECVTKLSAGVDCN